jgi:hypothetical protein
MCSEPRVLNVPLIWVGISDARPEYPQKEWTKVAAKNLVIVIAEPKLAGFNVQRCREIPSKAPEHRHKGAASAAFPNSFFTLVEVTITDTTAGFSIGYLFHEANFCSGDLRVSAWMQKHPHLSGGLINAFLIILSVEG